MNTLFSEYLAAGGNWMQSQLLMAHTSTQSSEIAGVEEYVMYKDLKKELGKNQAEELRSRKRLQQMTLAPGETPYVMPHPDWPDDEEYWANYYIL